MAVATDQQLDNLNIGMFVHRLCRTHIEPEQHLIVSPTSVHPLSPIIGPASGSRADHQATHHPISASHPSSTQPLALEHCVPDTGRVAELETTSIPALQESIKRLEDERRALVSDVGLCMQANAGLVMQVKGLLVENGTLRERITLLDTRFHDFATSANHKESSMSSVIVHTPGPESPVTPMKALDKGKGVERSVFEGGKEIVETAVTVETVMGQDIRYLTHMLTCVLWLILTIIQG